MGRRKEFQYAELPVDRFILESFANSRSAYHLTDHELSSSEQLGKFRSRLLWHINHSLSKRQKQVIKGFLAGQKEREMAGLLGVKQQVVHTYKRRAIKKLRGILAS